MGRPKGWPLYFKRTFGTNVSTVLQICYFFKDGKTILVKFNMFQIVLKGLIVIIVIHFESNVYFDRILYVLNLTSYLNIRVICTLKYQFYNKCYRVCILLYS